MRELPERVTVYQFPGGYPGTAATLRLMSQVLREEYGDPRMRARFRTITRDVAPLDVWGEVEAVWNFCLENIRYQRDPPGIEHITRPVDLDKQIERGTAAEDCESMALYAATLLAAGGIPSAWEAQGRDRARRDRFKHCSLIVTNPRTGEEASFDLVGAVEVDGFTLGDTLHRDGDPVERWSALDGERIAMGGMHGLFGDSGAGMGDAASDWWAAGNMGPPPQQPKPATPTTPAAPAYGNQPIAHQQAGTTTTTTTTTTGAPAYDWRQTVTPIVTGVSSIIQGIAPLLGPYGQIVGGVMKVGDGIYSAATGQPVGTVLPQPAKSGGGAIAAVGGALLLAALV